MSYDVGLWMNTGKQEVEVVDCGNYTYNVSPMLQLAFNKPKDGIYCLDGKIAQHCELQLSSAIAAMSLEPAVYRKINPSNGWGSYEGCMRWLRQILLNCEQHPLATLRIT